MEPGHYIDGKLNPPGAETVDIDWAYRTVERHGAKVQYRYILRYILRGVKGYGTGRLLLVTLEGRHSPLERPLSFWDAVGFCLFKGIPGQIGNVIRWRFRDGIIRE